MLADLLSSCLCHLVTCYLLVIVVVSGVHEKYQNASLEGRPNERDGEAEKGEKAGIRKNAAAIEHGCAADGRRDFHPYLPIRLFQNATSESYFRLAGAIRNYVTRNAIASIENAKIFSC